MKKFLNKLQSQTPLPRTNIERQGAMFAHLNAMVEDYQTFTTIISAEQAATLSSIPVELNVPTGMYLLAGGYVYYSTNATESLDLGSQQYIQVGNSMTISKNQNSPLSPGEILLLSIPNSLNSPVTSGKVFFATDADALTPPDGPVEITVYLTKLNLSII